MTTINKVIRVGSTTEYRRTGSNVYCSIEFTEEGILSITGVVGPMRNGNAHGGCGQIVMAFPSIDKFAPGWDQEALDTFLGYWDEWHLNDMVAGSPAQEAHLKSLGKWKRARDGFDSHYTWACAELEKVGLQPDPDHIHNDQPYRYGSAWLRKDVPPEVIEFLAALPDTDQEPAWV